MKQEINTRSPLRESTVDADSTGSGVDERVKARRLEGHCWRCSGIRRWNSEGEVQYETSIVPFVNEGDPLPGCSRGLSSG